MHLTCEVTRRNWLAQEPDAGAAPPVFKKGVSPITIDARVTRREGAGVSNLTASDFLVFDENERQKVTHFGRESNAHRSAAAAGCQHWHAPVSDRAHAAPMCPSIVNN